jgi:hypothetical protein
LRVAFFGHDRALENVIDMHRYAPFQLKAPSSTGSASCGMTR